MGDLSKLSIKPKKRSRATNPIEIFRGLTLRGNIENIFAPQAAALEQWDNARARNDVVIEMPTGGGKTLVGQLVAMSLVNEGPRKVVYVCVTNQLVEQTAERAAECGIDVATYMRGAWSRQDVYDSGTGPCITNYAALFNGRSIFFQHDIGALILDDAHVASNAIRSQFTIKVPRDDAAFRPIANCFREHFARNSQTQQLSEAIEGDPRALLFVPMFEVRARSSLLRKLLIDNDVAKKKETKFSWQYIKEHLDRCVVLISGFGIEVTPPILPIHRLPYFQDDVRRVYLTATLPSSVEFLRTFGVSSASKIAPGGKSGEAQRLFILASGEADTEQRETAKEIVKGSKACIVSPSLRAAAEWAPPAVKFDGTTGHKAIRAFAAARPPQKLVLAGRYDGIDLPDDACRVLVLDGLPSGTSLFDKFTDQSLKIEHLREAHTATRIVQAIGRIFRNNRDHGAVVVCGVDLQRWLRDPSRRKYMPPLLQQQIQLGLELRAQVDAKKATYPDLLQAVLTGRRDWDRLYSDAVGEFDTQPNSEDPAWFLGAVERERRAFRALWEGDFGTAASQYAEASDATERDDLRLAAWYWHWQGLALDLNGNKAAAAASYVRAANFRSELGRPKLEGGLPATPLKAPGAQAKKIAALITRGPDRLLTQIDSIRAALVYGPDTNPAEQALSELGTVLGLDASRPDKKKTGPDVLWRNPAAKGCAALEAKTNKLATSQYKKKEDIAQFHDHTKWLSKELPGEAPYLIIVGRPLRVSSDANPPDDLLVVGVEQFVNLAERARDLVEFVRSASTDVDRDSCVEQALELFGLAWPRCIESLDSKLAIDLQRDADSPEAGTD